MDFFLNINEFVLNETGSIMQLTGLVHNKTVFFFLNMTGFVLKRTEFVLNFTGFGLSMTELVLNNTRPFLNMTGFLLNIT